MKLNSLQRFSAAVCLALCAARGAVAATADPLPLITKAADGQLKEMNGKAPSDWVAGVFYVGLLELYDATHDPKYLQAMKSIGEQNNWRLRSPNGSAGPMHADGHTLGQMYLALFDIEKDPAMIAFTQRRMDAFVKYTDSPEAKKQIPWYWCDALFMAPSVLAHLTQITGDPRYETAMHREWDLTSEALYDKSEHLFFRDDRFLKRTTRGGKKVFWSRGNGWVVAGLVRVLEQLKPEDPARAKYIKQLQEMSAALAAIQPSDGIWRPSLLDADDYTEPEASGTALICYGLAWGVNHGVLDEKKYAPVIANAWAGLVKCQREDGILGYVQPPGDQPRPLSAQSSSLYGTGAFIMAGVEVMKLKDRLPEPNLVAFKPAAKITIAPTTAPSTPAPNAKAFARYIPEREDDIAWENDRIAFRIYGPKLETSDPAGSGIDVWAKSTRDLIINDWYKTGDYHEDHGKGLDFYKVGTSRGCGGLGIWQDGKLYNSADWHHHRVVNAGPDTAGFEVVYDPWQAGNRTFWEERYTSLKAGSNLNRISSTLHSDSDKPFIVGIGIAKRTGNDGQLFQDKSLGILGYWEPAEGNNGHIACGVIVDPKQIEGFAEDAENYLVLIRSKPGSQFIYYAGAAWSKGLDIHTPQEWIEYLKKNTIKKPTTVATVKPKSEAKETDHAPETSTDASDDATTKPAMQ